MQKCPKCGHTNRLGVLFCEKCGTYLRSGSVPGSTKSLDQAEQQALAPILPQDPPTPASEPTRGTDIFPTGASLRLEIEGSPEPLVLTVSQRDIVLGRRDPATGALPEVDLTPFAGYRMGVSRRHSQIRPTEDGHLELFDLGSSNGTFLNGQRLEAHYPYRLHHGDKLGLGQIVIRVFFQEKTEKKESVEAAADTNPSPPAPPLATPEVKSEVAPVPLSPANPEPENTASKSSVSVEDEKLSSPQDPPTDSNLDKKPLGDS